ncbi:hypothetical protein DACRYDRAFT_74378 [Dacryopinax primogenitus]|uniref:P-loop containing nucleoside triphosphate hydrolase protein n=1 Tax=Dacryopinax primogenitus (strain DJM 731) TaxID=1858805 RepID=M5G920_DACPD|nr:uncharacterized protein DACRYDRAFT_74378 [Dacryopinax primogenitus]EJU05219.1 hypothetical protein DACRYDRAFT_74378 [Dacryopinax primogenitus]
MVAGDKPDESVTELQIIGAGMPRTGTALLHAALMILGFGPCHHGSTLPTCPERSIMYLHTVGSKSTDFRSLMSGFRATVDSPGCDFVPELMAAFPNAKVVLSLRDSPNAWWKSFSETVYETSFPSYQLLVYPIPFMRYQFRVVTALLNKKWLPRYGVKAGPEVYVRHNEFIRKIVPPERLLEFNVKEGWEPLCKFLGVPVPDVPFPHTNDSATVKANIRMAKLMGLACWIGILTVAGGAYYWGVNEGGWKAVAGFIGKFL